jgi:hypothetical protein
MQRLETFRCDKTFRFHFRSHLEFIFSIERAISPRTLLGVLLSKCFDDVRHSVAPALKKNANGPLNSWSETLILLLKETTSIEKKRERPKMMFPLWRSFTWRRAATGYNEDLPEAIPGLNQGMFTSRRNPDHSAPITLLQEIGELIHSSTRWMTRSDILFGIKSAFLLPLVALPAFFPSSAFFFYTERGIWVVIMAALTSQQFVGDTAFGFVSRIYGTLGSFLSFSLRLN